MTTAAAGQPLEQLWNVEYVRNDVFALVNLASGKVLDYDGESITLKNSDNSGTQLWRYAGGSLANEEGYALSGEVLLAQHEYITADSVSISLDVTEMREGEQIRLNIAASPAAAAATGFDWDISGSGSVDISDNGTITALKAGAVNIAAVAKGSGAVSNTVTLTVNRSCCNG